ncbi:hypothetical protein DB30_02058 [Enhygromyxa salina]|uniref:Lipoprotein n=1 Tax=Enhygromyxa salina TaxID=215803 RepID=A0A0C1Z3A2_9BACT|nr:hypothetical protein [Enhygromyxa salina]KIG12084.1 hypothetical protein DB30_02058 [Enhygromyxa salina]
MLGRPRSVVVAGLVVLVTSSCRTTPRDCDDATNERCLWNQGLRKPIASDNEPGQDEVATDPHTSLGSDAKLNEAVTQLVDMMRTGLEWSLVDARARSLCVSEVEADPATDPPTDPATDPPTDGDEGGGASAAWHCDTALLIDTQNLVLEATAAVLSLSTAPLDESASAELLDLARGRFEPWCASEFEELEGTNHLLFYRCALPEGPFLVVARFPRDLDAGAWQVSIAILDAG